MTAAAFTWRALGTTATLVVTDPADMTTAREAVQRVLDEVDRACSRFRPDSEVVRLGDARDGVLTASSVLLEAIVVALRVAEITDGLVDPTVGAALAFAGYDRDFVDIPGDSAVPLGAPPGVPGWRAVEIDPARRTVRVPPGTVLDLGSSGKAWAADRAAERASRATHGAGVLVSLGGDVAVAGPAPSDGWPVGVGDHHGGSGDVSVIVRAGGIATSSTTGRRWRRDGREFHHVIDPRTGEPAPVRWRTATVAADTCVDANAASTAAIVLGAAAPRWLEARGLPARLVSASGDVRTVGAWPAEPVVAA